MILIDFVYTLWNLDLYLYNLISACDSSAMLRYSPPLIGWAVECRFPQPGADQKKYCSGQSQSSVY